MKTLLVTLSIALAGASTASAEIYRPSVVGRTTVLGAVAGALIGGHNGDRWAEGAVIGAAAGAVLGTVADQSQPVRYSSREIAPVMVVSDAPVIGAPGPTVVYVNTPPPPPQVVYVESYPLPVVVRPVIHFSTGWRSGYDWGHHHGHYRSVYNRHGHGGHGDHGRRDGHRR